MAYLQTVEIDGLKIIRGFNPPPVDPQVTKRVVNKLLRETDEFRKIKSAGAVLRKLYVKRSAQMRRMTDFMKVKTGPAEVKALRESLKQVAQDIEKAHKQMVEFQPALKKKRTELYEKHLVRSTIPNCKVVDDKTVKTLSGKLSKLDDGQCLTVDGKVVEDRRRSEYYYKDGEKWIHTKVTKLGQSIPVGAKLGHELTYDDKTEIIQQRQRKIVSTMPDNGRSQERQRAIEAAIRNAALMKSGYEIEGREKPGEDARTWLESRKKEIEVLYG